MEEVLISGKTSFKIEVPYKLIETGEKGEKPLLVYLHGYNQNINYFQKKWEKLKQLKAYHLFVQGPYPVFDGRSNKDVANWGRAWYLYDGNQQQFIKSMEVASEFIQEIIDGLANVIKINRLGMIGYSMGGYLAGYFALSRWRHVNDLVVIGGRIKTETFEGKLKQVSHMNILALHGKNDTRVLPGPQQKCIQELKQAGAAATFKMVNAEHNLESSYISKTYNWLQKIDYVES